MVQSHYQDIVDFHEKFGLEGPAHPVFLTPEVQGFRQNFMYEELEEYREAIEAGDLAKAFDALLDLVYVAIGTAYLHGFPWNEGWNLVQAANMAKVRAQAVTDSKRGSAYDVVKPAGWKPPQIERLVFEALLRHIAYQARVLEGDARAELAGAPD